MGEGKKEDIHDKAQHTFDDFDNIKKSSFNIFFMKK